MDKEIIMEQKLKVGKDLHVLITGTAGFIGHHIAIKMIGAGYQVTGIDNLNQYYDVELKLGRLGKQGFKGPFEYG